MNNFFFFSGELFAMRKILNCNKSKDTDEEFIVAEHTESRCYHKTPWLPHKKLSGVVYWAGTCHVPESVVQLYH